MQSRYSFLWELSFQNAQTQHSRGRASRSDVKTRQRALAALRFQIHVNDLIARGPDLVDAAMNGRVAGAECGRTLPLAQRTSSSSHPQNCSSHCIDVRLVGQPTRAGVNVPACEYGTGDPNTPNTGLPYRTEIEPNSHPKSEHGAPRMVAWRRRRRRKVRLLSPP